MNNKKDFSTPKEILCCFKSHRWHDKSEPMKVTTTVYRCTRTAITISKNIHRVRRVVCEILIRAIRPMQSHLPHRRGYRKTCHLSPWGLPSRRSLEDKRRHRRWWQQTGLREGADGPRTWGISPEVIRSRGNLCSQRGWANTRGGGASKKLNNSMTGHILKRARHI